MRPIREITVPEAAAHFGVSQHTLRTWIRDGAPHSRVPSMGGGEKRIALNLEEIERWLKKRPWLHKVRDPEEVVAIEDLVPQLNKLRELGYTKKQIAQKLGIPPSTLNTYLFPKLYRMTGAPLKIYLKTLALLKTSSKVRHREKRHSEQEVITALKAAKGIRAHAARKLKISDPTLNDLIEKYSLQSFVKYLPSEWITVSMIQKTLTQTGGNIKAASRIFKIDDQSLRRLISQAKQTQFLAKLREKVQRSKIQARSKKVSRKKKLPQRSKKPKKSSAKEIKRKRPKF